MREVWRKEGGGIGNSKIVYGRGFEHKLMENVPQGIFDEAKKMGFY